MNNIKNIEIKRKIQDKAVNLLNINNIFENMDKDGYVDILYEILNKIYDKENENIIKIWENELETEPTNTENKKNIIKSEGYKQNLKTIINIMIDNVWKEKLKKNN